MIGITGISGDANQALIQATYALPTSVMGASTGVPEAASGAGNGGTSAAAQRIVFSGIKQILGLVQITTGDRFDIVG